MAASCQSLRWRRVPTRAQPRPDRPPTGGPAGATGRRAGAAAEVRRRAVLHLPSRPGPAQPGGRRGAPRALRRRRWTAVAAGAAGRCGGGRRPRRGASTSTAASASARRTCWPRLWHAAEGPKAFGTFVELHQPGRRARLRPDGRGVPGPPAALHRRVRARRPRRHRADVDAARRGWPTRGCPWPRPPTPCRAPSARAGSRRTTSCARSRRLSARFQVADGRRRGLPPPRARAQPRAAVGRRGGQPAWTVRVAPWTDFDDLLAHLATVHPSRYGALLDGVDAVGWQRRAPDLRPERRAAAGRPRRPAVRPGRPRLRQWHPAG